jgi:galactokinase
MPSTPALQLPDSHAATTGFRERYGREPEAVWLGPGRVNLIGEHTDYNDGLVLPFAIDARASVAAGANPDGVVRVVSAQRPGKPEVRSLADLRPSGPVTAGWTAYLFGAVWALQSRDIPVTGVDLALNSMVPTGAGLSSSAALECATALAVSTLAGVKLPVELLARIAQQAENDFVGVPCGLMDQMASTAARAGHLLFFDIGRDVVEHIPFDPGGSGLAVLVIDTRAHHSLADGEYAKRRASCEQAAAELGIASLRELDGGDLDAALARLSTDLLRRRVRHIVTENDRVRQVVALLREGRMADIGSLMTASHLSLRDDYEVSADELDVAVDAALAAGALGARMTGGGFGGSTIALVAADQQQVLARAVADAFEQRGFTAPVIRSVSPAEGARRDG